MSTEKRAPLLSDEAANNMRDETWTSGRDSWEDPMNATRDFYEDLITRGYLMVVKNIDIECPECGCGIGILK